MSQNQTDNILAQDKTHRRELIREIGELEKRLQPHDTGHIRTAISVLKARIKEIDRYQADEQHWKDELLLGI